MAVMSPFQGENAGSTPATRSKKHMSVRPIQDTISTASSETEQANDEVLRNLVNGIYCEESGIQLQLPSGEEEDAFILSLDQAFNNPQILRFLHPNTPYTYDNTTRVTTRAFVKYFSQPEKRCFLYAAYTNEPSANGGYARKLIGFGSLFGVDDNLSVERGVMIFNPENWNKGYGKRIGVTLMLLAKRSGIKTLTAGTYSNNTASLTNLRKQFRQMGIPNVEMGEDVIKGQYYEFLINMDEWTEPDILALLNN